MGEDVSRGGRALPGAVPEVATAVPAAALAVVAAAGTASEAEATTPVAVGRNRYYEACVGEVVAVEARTPFAEAVAGFLLLWDPTGGPEDRADTV